MSSRIVHQEGPVAGLGQIKSSRQSGKTSSDNQNVGV
jgi:hypothetical protein